MIKEKEIKRYKVKEEFSRDLYWTKMEIKSDDRNVKIYSCVSWEYLANLNKSYNINETHINNWHRDLNNEIDNLDQAIFNDDVHYRVYASTEEGKKNGLEFLKTLD